MPKHLEYGTTVNNPKSQCKVGEILVTVQAMHTQWRAYTAYIGDARLPSPEPAISAAPNLPAGCCSANTLLEPSNGTEHVFQNNKARKPCQKCQNGKRNQAEIKPYQFSFYSRCTMWPYMPHWRLPTSCSIDVVLPIWPGQAVKKPQKWDDARLQ